MISFWEWKYLDSHRPFSGSRRDASGREDTWFRFVPDACSIHRVRCDVGGVGQFDLLTLTHNDFAVEGAEKVQESEDNHQHAEWKEQARRVPLHHVWNSHDATPTIPRVSRPESCKRTRSQGIKEARDKLLSTNPSSQSDGGQASLTSLRIQNKYSMCVFTWPRIAFLSVAPFRDLASLPTVLASTHTDCSTHLRRHINFLTRRLVCNTSNTLPNACAWFVPPFDSMSLGFPRSTHSSPIDPIGSRGVLAIAHSTAHRLARTEFVI